MSYVGIIDLGSNTVRLVIYYRDRHGVFYEHDNVKRTLRLINHVRSDGTIDDAGIRKVLDCMRQFKELCKINGVSEILGVATAAIRQAVNGPELLSMIEEQVGIRIRLLGGAQEAYYSYLAVVNSMSVATGFTVDIGGGSTEVTYFENRQCKHAVSFPFGAVTLTKSFFQHEIPTEGELQSLHSYLVQQFAREEWIRKQDCPLIAVGGTARSVAQIHQKSIQYSLASLHHYVMPSQEVEQLYCLVCQLPINARKKIPGLSKDRSDIIVAGLAIFRALLTCTESREFVSSSKGLRDGVIFENFLRSTGAEYVEDVGMFSVDQFVNRYQVNRAHARHVSSLATQLFDQLERMMIINYRSAERRWLQVAALLHDVGRSINVYETSQHTFYLLSRVLLMGFTHRERLLIAMISSYKNSKQLQEQMLRHRDIVKEADKRMIEELGQLLLLARALDRFMQQQVVRVTAKQQKDKIILECTSTEENVLEYTFLDDVLDRFSKSFKRTFTYAIKHEKRD